MLSDEKAQEIFANEHCNISKELAGILARAIEAEMLEEWLPQKQRIAELEEAAREARDALQYKLHVVEAIAKLDAVLGNAALTGAAKAD